MIHLLSTSLLRFLRYVKIEVVKSTLQELVPRMYIETKVEDTRESSENTPVVVGKVVSTPSFRELHSVIPCLLFNQASLDFTHTTVST